MMKEVVRAMETGYLAYVGLFAFIFAFVMILARVAIMKKAERTEAKNLPLGEPTEFYPEQN
ncbi:MAG: hypothetical protein HOC28_00090 [Bacteroidetes Order II. Incertae sedis bacterium]|jgi:hypothetical protein|nr:hypothetical protein [Bacteroidetes Order II. bacterium]MDG1753800.1 hypothetical protein [Rhodothermales bacterium]MBT4052290.1 hypothetical protein [Bacteroidetes Order II. bacterium]MBT4601508.1 hypothetical protein [Bacteroidetes Order II. bacterium]MBT5250329.1 hypothetical protein [Bacteroidetes Order II. bacterium]